MTTATQRETHERWLLELTGLPTAAGREQRVIQWIEHWAASRKGIRLERDRAGNLHLHQAEADDDGDRPALYFTAHLDHPAFVVRRITGAREVEAEFRGGVHAPYFEKAAVELFDELDGRHPGRIAEVRADAVPFKIVTIELSRTTDALAPGDVGRWEFRGKGGTPVIDDGRLHAPACDDLAGVAAALSALDVVRRRAGARHVRVLLTRAEEIGFVGAIGACRTRSIPRRAELVCLECSRSFADSPIGGGPIVRVGDKAGVFDPALTNRITHLATEHAKKHDGFRVQRKLMPGGTCEATTFGTYGYTSTCLCLPLGNYHNMTAIDAVAAGKRPARVAPEHVSISDFHGLVELLVLCARKLHETTAADLKRRLDGLWDRHKALVAGPGTAR